MFLSPEERQFILTHLTTDPAKMMLRSSPGPNIRLREVANQLIARQKARQKLPTWYQNPDLTFPPPLSVEQASSEATADYKASLVGGQLLLDLTGGLGVDALAFARRVGRVIYAEQQPLLADLAAHNLPLLGGHNILIHNDNGLHVLQHLESRADWVYLDPARRDERGGKVVRLQDCEPDVLSPDWQLALKAKPRHILLKTSPLIDLDAALRALGGAVAVHVVAHAGECKEVLFILSGESEPDCPITAVHLGQPAAPFTFRRSEEREADVRWSEPAAYLYEPGPALLKAGAFRSLASRYDLMKLAPNSHLYTSHRLVDDFPGRRFIVLGSCRPDRRALQALLPAAEGYKANLTVRNFPEATEVLRRNLKLAEGGDTYVFATTLLDGSHRLVVTRKVPAA